MIKVGLPFDVEIEHGGPRQNILVTSKINSMPNLKVQYKADPGTFI